MKRFFVLSLVLVASLFVPIASAQEVQVSQNSTETPEDGRYVIDDQTVLVETEVRGDTAILTFESDTSQSLTITDAAFRERGTLERYTRVIDDGRSTVRVPLSTVNGRAAVVIEVDSGAHYALPLRTSPVFIGGPWTASDTRIAAGAAGLSVSIVSILMVIRYLRTKNHTVERIA